MGSFFLLVKPTPQLGILKGLIEHAGVRFRFKMIRRQLVSCPTRTGADPEIFYSGGPNFAQYGETV